MMQQKHLKQFDLSKIPSLFAIPSFERRISDTTITKITESIMQKKLKNMVIHVSELDDGRYQILDGQHRIKALERCYHKHGLTHHELMLIIHPLEIAREVYTNLNIARPLQARDHTKALDDGTITFFNQLSSQLWHYKTTKLMSFYDGMLAIQYARHDIAKSYQNKYPYGSIKPDGMKDFLDTISKKETETLKKVITQLTKLSPTVYASIYWHAPLFWNLYKVSINESFTESEIYEFALKMAADKKIISLMADRNMGIRYKVRTINELSQKWLTPKKIQTTAI